MIVIRPNGLPAYSQSFDFESVFACRTFHNRLSEVRKKSNLLGGYFQVIKDMISEVIEDQLKMIDLGFSSYQMLGLVEESYLFLGIFENQYNPEGNGKLMDIMSRIAERFMTKYRAILFEEEILDISRFENFTYDLLELGISLSMQRRRNCLTNCTDEIQGCIPHLIYFKESFERV